MERRRRDACDENASMVDGACVCDEGFTGDGSECTG